MVEKRFEESRSRSPKDCVHRGLGQRLNKQKNHSFRGSGMDGFSHLYYRCIACQYYTKLGIRVASNAYGAPYAKALISAKVEMRVFCLLRLCPKPHVERNLSDCGYAIFPNRCNYLFRMRLYIHA